MSARRRHLALLAGAVLGMVAAAIHLLRPAPTQTAAEDRAYVARVDGHGIPRSDYERAIAAVAGDRREGLRTGDPERVLERLIDEELLVQRGVELGLAERDPRVRAELARAMLDLLRARAEEEARRPSEAALRAHYRKNAGWFGDPTDPPPYDAVRDLVAADYQRRAAERALDAFLTERRRAVRIERYGLTPP